MLTEGVCLWACSGLRQIRQDTEQLYADGQRQESLIRGLQSRQQAAEKKAQACNVQATTVTKILDQVRTGSGVSQSTKESTGDLATGLSHLISHQ
ncbi:hypothetical protein SKAU_G00158750 [Synaphobranchus kaupii]|uniref:Uncharacterized protein n=1 Tax=Synaphobranchus kaupii TaxID=118154 RepID=A0A9Q1FI37_SYNKA|nr:hypothetical protein SKAU_G00158750 [Synaphobranchus kaupii]